MYKMLPGILLVLLLLAATSGPVLAQGTCEANGRVLDHEGNPLQGALLTFTPKNNAAMSYTDTTNKKGRYFVSGMFSSQGDVWQVTIELEGYAPVEMVVESRNAQRVLVGDIYTKKLKAGSGPWEFPIRPLGSAKVDFKMVPADQVVELAPQSASEEQVQAAQVKQQEQQKDPWDEALSLAGGGDLDGSIPLFEEAIEEEPEDAERRRTMAQVLYRLERLDEAAAQALAAIELAPDDIEARMVLYGIYVADGDLEQAKTALDGAREVAPDDLRVLRQLAFVAGEAGDSEAAIEAYEAVVEVDPQDTESWMALGDLYAAAGDLEASGQAYERVAELAPDNAHQIFFNIGALTMNKANRSDADTRKAINAFRKAVEIKPDYAQAHKQLAFALLATGDRPGAKAALKQYVEHAPNASDAAQMRNLIQTLGG